jgi:pimeloyl-ACP methyl ester carboxylesterase
MQPLPPVVLVHGFWHGSWCWQAAIAELAARGVPAVAVDLDGHGLRSRSPRSRWGRPFDPSAYAVEPSATADVTASSAAASLVDDIRLIGGGRPALVVAHSMGGTVATAAAELAPELFSELMYVAAFAPVSGIPAMDYITCPEGEGELVSRLLAADPAVVGALRLDSTDSDQRPAFRETFYGDVDPAVADAAIALLGPDGPVGVVAEKFGVTIDRYGSMAHSYVVCTQDRAIPLPLQRRFVTEINSVSKEPTTVIDLETSHSPFLSRPGAFADVIQTAYRRAVVPSR